ncbi:MAG TPA: aspartate-alanine antiporter [Deltaproteobacteria bacterium]|nr:aspartate-alanine antiporter [Deltaproteobacteria bacterium]HPR54033.1 aspartate-alanine antiporter [Deltaproteobacteria bacterium]HXK46813.1 aspartate-alanine antiporter [Deltaproteobacteria bacterium]
MTHQIGSIIQESPEILVFLSMALGYAIGRIKVRGFGIGTTASVLLAAMVLGQFGIDVPPILKGISFALFAFCIGYQVGPQFFGALRKEGLNYLWVSVVVALAGLACVVVLGRVLHFDKGTAAGLFAGAMTQSAAIGTANGAVGQLAVSAAEKQVLSDNIAVAFAITYLFGVVGVIIFFKLLPGLFRIDLKAEAGELERAMGGGSDLKSPELFSWSRQVGLRAYETTNHRIIGKSVREVEGLFSPARVAVYQVLRRGILFEPLQETILEEQDTLVIAGKYVGLVRAPDIVGTEVDVSVIIDLIGESLDVCVLNPAVVGMTLGEIALAGGARGIFLTRMTRQGHDLPILEDTVVNKCDILHLVGTRNEVEQAARALGYAQRPSAVTDLVMVGAGCVLGTLAGMIVIPLGGIPLTLGTGGGVLVAGLVCGWLRSVHPTFGQISDGGQWLLNDLGLSLFVACIGLSSGKAALAALQASGLAIFLAGIVLALVPIVAGMVFGRYVLKMNPVLLLGALTGARVIPQAMTALEEDAGSTTPALGFAAPFAFANVFLTVMGSIIINVM